MPTKNPQFLLAAVLILFIAGCASTLQVIDTNTPPLVLQKSQLARFYITQEVIFPAGTYIPDFKTKDGLFYRAPTKMAHSALSSKVAKSGGIVVPFPEDKDQRLGVWFEPQEGPGFFFRLRDPIEYEVQKTAK